MSKMNFAIALKMTTAQFQKGANVVKAGIKSIQYQVLGMASALGLGTIGLKNMVSRFVDAARETNRARVALSNVSGGVQGFTENINFANRLSKQYGQDLNGITSNFARFSAAANAAGVELKDQHRIYSSITKAITAFGLSSNEAGLTYMALSQMMSKGKISSEELRQQMGERIPIAMEAMARAAGVTVQELDKLLKDGKIYSAEVLPKFAEQLEAMLGTVDTDNIETSLSRLRNAFIKLTQDLRIGDLYKRIVDGAVRMLENIQSSFARVATTIASVLLTGKIAGAFKKLTITAKLENEKTLSNKIKTEKQAELATTKRVEAEKRLNELSAIWTKNVQDQTLANKIRILNAEKALDKARLNEKAALLAQEEALVSASANKQQTVWTIAGRGISNAAKGALAGIGAMFKSIIPMAIIGTAINFVMRLREARKEAKEISEIFSNYQKEMSRSSTSNEIEKIKSLHRVVNQRLGTEQQIKAAEKELIRLLGVEEGKQIDINKKVAERVKLLEASARVDRAIQAKLDAETGIKEIGAKHGTGDSVLKTLQTVKNPNFAFFGTSKATREYDKMVQLARVWVDAQKTIDKYAPLSVTSTYSPPLEDTKTAKEKYKDTKNELDELAKIEKEYYDKLNELFNLQEVNLISEKELKERALDIAKDTRSEIAKLYGNRSTENELFNITDNIVKGNAPLPTEKSRDTTFDYKKDELQQLKELRELKAKYIAELKEIKEEDFAGITDLIDSESAALQSIDDLIKAGTIKKDIEDISKQIKEGVFSNIEDVYNLLKNVGQAFTNIVDTFKDADATFFDKLIAIFDALFSTIGGIAAVMESIKQTRALIGTRKGAKEGAVASEVAGIAAVTSAKIAADTTEATSAATKSAAVVAGLTAEEVAAKGVMAAKSAAAYASIPGAGIALAAGQIAAFEGLIAASKVAAAIPGFTDGGVMGGSSFTGDKLLARINSGEMVINKKQQSYLFDGIKNRTIFKNVNNAPLGEVELKIRGRDLVGVLNQESKIKSRV